MESYTDTDMVQIIKEATLRIYLTFFLRVYPKP
jgi:hypothetical protein